jgi:hypothetical protein
MREGYGSSDYIPKEATVVLVYFKALCYKQEGRGFHTWWGDFF